MATPVIEAADATESGDDAQTGSWSVSVPNASTGDLLLFCLSWDDSVTTGSVTPPSGQNSETLTAINATPATGSNTDERCQVFYTVATGAWTAGTVTFTPSASESFTAAVIRVPAGEFDGTTPIGASVTMGSPTTTSTTVQHDAFTAGSTDGDGRLCVWTGVDTDPQTLAGGSGFSQVCNTDRGTISGAFFTRDTAVSNSESFSATTVSTIASDSWATVAFVVRAPAGVVASFPPVQSHGYRIAALMSF